MKQRLMCVVAAGAVASVFSASAAAQLFVADLNETLSFSDVDTGTSVFTFDIPGFGDASTDIDIFVLNSSSSFFGTQQGLEVDFGGFGDGTATRVSDNFFTAGTVIDSFPTAPFSNPPRPGGSGNILFSEAVPSLSSPSNNGQFSEAADGDIGYIGFVLQADDLGGNPVPGSFHFGYIELTFDDLTDGAASVIGSDEFTLTLTKIALVTTPDVGIIAGGGAVPTPGAAGLLALAGLASARRRRR